MDFPQQSRDLAMSLSIFFPAAMSDFLVSAQLVELVHFLLSACPREPIPAEPSESVLRSALGRAGSGFGYQTRIPSHVGGGETVPQLWFMLHLGSMDTWSFSVCQ